MQSALDDLATIIRQALSPGVSVLPVREAVVLVRAGAAVEKGGAVQVDSFKPVLKAPMVSALEATI